MTLPTNSSHASGILDTSTGRIIPASKRADGSTRREIRVRPGFTPPEDVEVYKNRRAEAWKNRGTGGVPGADEPGTDVPKTPASDKNAKRREARKRAKAKKEGENPDDEDNLIDLGSETSKSGTTDGTDLIDLATPEKNKKGASLAESASLNSARTPSTQGDREKLGKSLRKKLSQAQALKDKKDGGEKLLPEQLEKMMRINELTRQLKALGVDDGAENSVESKTDDKEAT